MIIKTNTTQRTNYSPPEPFVGELETVKYDLSGPYHYTKNGKPHTEASIEARIIGSMDHMISRHHAGRPYDHSMTALIYAPLKLMTSLIMDTPQYKIFAQHTMKIITRGLL